MFKSIYQEVSNPIRFRAESELIQHCILQCSSCKICQTMAALLKGNVEEDPADNVAALVWSAVKKQKDNRNQNL